MSLHRYADQCFSIAHEIQEELTGDEYEDVFREIGKFSRAEWYVWRSEHEAETKRLATATPAKRRQLLADMQDRSGKLRMVFAACQYCIEAREILLAFLDHCKPGTPYRKMIGSTHEALNQIENEVESFWPWGGWPGYRDFPPADPDEIRKQNR